MASHGDYYIPMAAMAGQGPAMASHGMNRNLQSCHGHAMATLEISEYFTPPNWLAMATFDHGVAMADLDNGWPWQGHGDFGDF